MKALLLKGLSLLVAVMLVVTVLCGCDRLMPMVDPINDNYRVFYQIFVGSFSDSNGDGCGDLRGIINRLDYLNDGNINSGKSLGVQGIWLSPIFASPSYHKYDVTNYYKIDEKFGTEQDLIELIELCNSRNILLILDLPINHTSSSNLMFQKFVDAHKSGDTDNEYYDFYTHCSFSERKGGHAYSLIPGCTDDYYECNFSTDMPELNFDLEEVREYALDVAKYYLALGVDGFRFDAVKYIYYSNTKNSSAFWDWYMAELRKVKSDIYCIGECWSADSETLQYISSLNCFNFQMAQGEGYIASAAKGASMSLYTDYVEKYLDKVLEQNPNGMVIPFISNHDMDRSAGYLTLASKRMYMAANLYLLCSGSPVIYYGEEIGLKGTRGAANTDANRRLAMLWGDEDTVRDPVGTSYDNKKQTNGTVAEHQKNSDSLYNYYCKVIALRNKYPEIARGDYKSLVYDEDRFGGFLITYKDEITGVFHNTSDREITVDLSKSMYLYDHEFSQLCDYIGQGSAKLDGSVLTIGPQTSVIVK